MIQSGQRINIVKFKKLANGKIVKNVEEQYLRQDIPCGLANCPLCDKNEKCNLNLTLADAGMAENVRMKSDEDEEVASVDKIFIIDHQFALNQYDFIENCQVPSNMVLPDSVLKYINRKNIQAFHGLRNLMEQEQRQIYYFYNENFAETYVKENLLQGKGLDLKLKSKVASIYQWYFDHLQGLTKENKVYLLTDNFQSKQDYLKLVRNEQQIGVITMEDFILINQEDHPELVNFMGFADEQNLEDAQMQDLSSAEPVYDDHLPFDEMVLGIKEGKFFQGRLNVSRVNIEEATISIEGLNSDLLILGVKNQNRACNGDIVCVEIQQETEWVRNYKSGQPLNMLEQEAEVEDNSEGLENLENETQSKQKINIMQKINNDAVKRATGKVKGVLKKMNKTYGGSILRIQDHSKQTQQKFEAFIKNMGIEKSKVHQYRVFVPFNIQLPQAIVKSIKPEVLENQRFILRIGKWSKYSPFPYGQFVRILGEEGKMQTESAMILHEFNVDTRPFSQKVIKCLPSQGANWQIPQDEIDKRLDLRGECICSVDPIGCKDIDDALHCKVLPNGNYEVGVHIADVTHFVKAGAEIDKEAARRCTTVYLVERRTDMLPGLLTENLCSIRGGVERLAFSVIWEIDSKTLRAVKTDYRKTVIKSRAALDYYTAQDMIDNPNDKSELTEALRRLLKIATVLRDRRNEKGALTLASPEIKFKLDVDRENPTDASEYKHVSTHYMIEEFMLLANIAVAEKIVMHYPSFAILRRHPQPKQKEVSEFVDLLQRQGFEMSLDTSKSFAESLDRANKPKDPFFNKIVRIMATRCMHQAVYFCLADFDISEVFHYGLAVPVYTHFTSPIRRYADVLVHRLLAAAIDIQSLTNEMTDKFKMARQCDQMNRKNRMAQLASQASIQFNTYLFFRNIMVKEKKDLIQQAMIMRITKAGVYVMVKAYGIEGLLTDNDKQSISVDVENEQALINGQVTVKNFDTLEIQIVPISIEFRRQIQFIFKQKLEVQKQAIQEMIDESQDQIIPSLSDAKKSKKKKNK